MAVAGKKNFLSEYFNHHENTIKQYGEKSIVFMQKGEFYELYSIKEEFKKVCEILNLLCTRVNKKIKQNICLENPYMAGFKFSLVDRYAKILLEKNYTIVLVDELEVDENHKGPKTRKISRTLSPSTYIESHEINTLLCIFINTNEMSMGSFDLATGKIFLYGDQKYEIDTILDVISKISPREIVFFFNDQSLILQFDETFLSDNKTIVKKLLLNKEFEKINYQNIFLNKIYNTGNLGISSIEQLHLEKLPLTSTVLCLGIQYAIDHDPLLVTNIKQPEIYQKNKTLLLSENTIVQLHLHDLFRFIDNTKTSMGSRLLKDRIFNPFINSKNIQNSYTKILDIISQFKQIQEKLKTIRDLDKFHRRISSRKFTVIELPDTRKSLQSSFEIIKEISTINSFCINESTIKNLNILLNHLDIYFTFDENKSLFNKGKYSDLDELYEQKEALLEEFETIKLDFAKDLNVDDLKVGNVNDKLYFIVSKKKALEIKKIRDIKIGGTQSECRISDERIEEISDTLSSINLEIEKFEKTKFLEFCDNFSNKFCKTINNISKLIADIDFCCSAANIIINNKFTIPNINTTNNLSIKKLRHPLIESSCKATYVSNDCNIDDNQIGMLLFGQNFSGKTSYIRSVGMCIILAQSGLPVPSSEMSFTPFKQLITKIALGDNMHRGQSTFTNEMKEVKNMIETTDKNTIILADELCSGTETNSALSLVASTLIYLNKLSTRFIFTTHFHDLVEIEEIKEIQRIGIYHMKVSIVNGKQVFNRILEPGKCEDNYGIEIAQSMRMPNDFIHQAVLIRNRLLNNKTLISTKKSKYNSKIYMTECQLCKSKEELQTHHIIFQSQHEGEGKNYKNNLIVLCENCHEKLHKNEISIKGLTETSEGIIIN
jgi:DNA mismatch repair protein MutS